MTNQTPCKYQLSILIFGFAFFFALKSAGQVSIPGSSFSYIDKLADTTTLSLYESISYDGISEFQAVNPIVRLSYNSKYPRGFNDGFVWKGKGLTSEIHFGLIGKKGKISYAFVPGVFYSQNASYNIGQISPYAYDFSFRLNGERRIDWVQRYGDGDFVHFSPGQSEANLSLGKTLWSLSTQNYSLGPAVYNPIMLSRQASGFYHFRFGIPSTSLRLLKKNLGKIEGFLIYGLLKESEYFDNDDTNDNRFFNALTLSYSPSFIEGLKVGFHKVLYKQTRFFEKEDLFSPIYVLNDGVFNGDTLSVNDLFDQLVSATLEWKFPASDFRVYAEWTRNDFTTVIEPEHSRSYTVGLEKIIRTRNKNILVNYEHTNLSRNATSLWRPAGMYYVHSVNKQGYTNDGQIIGAGIGPGGNSDHLKVQLENEKFLAGMLLQRIENNRDFFTYYIQDAERHDIEYSLGFMFQKLFDPVLLSGEITMSYNYNKYYQANQRNTFISLGAQLLLFD